LPQAQHKVISPTRKTLPASLKDDTTRMNDINKHKVTEQMNQQTADPKANASVFLFFPTAHFLKTILASRTNGTFGFAPTHKPKLRKTKRAAKPIHKPTQFAAHLLLPQRTMKVLQQHST
jgi:hypothetical protein